MICFFRVILTFIIHLKPLFSLNKFFTLFLITDNKSLKFLLLISSTLKVSAYPLNVLSFFETLISSENGHSRNNSSLLNFLILGFFMGCL